MKIGPWTVPEIATAYDYHATPTSEFRSIVRWLSVRAGHALNHMVVDYNTQTVWIWDK